MPILYFLQTTLTSQIDLIPKVDLSEVKLVRGTSFKLKVTLETKTDPTKPITLTVMGLPEGVTVADVKLDPGKKEAELELKATPTAILGDFQVVVNALVQHNPLVSLDRFSEPIRLKVSQ